MEEKYSKLRTRKMIRRAFNKANARCLYADACYLYDKYSDVLERRSYGKSLCELRRKIDSYKTNFYTPWYKLSQHERLMIISVLDYDLMKHLWENKLILYHELSSLFIYIKQPHVLRYLYTVVHLDEGPCHGYPYLTYMNQSDMYLLICQMLNKVDNELLHITPLAYHIYKFTDTIMYHKHRWTNSFKYDELIYNTPHRHDIMQRISTNNLTDRLLLDNPTPMEYIRNINYRGRKMFYLVASLQIFAFGAILLKALV